LVLALNRIIAYRTPLKVLPVAEEFLRAMAPYQPPARADPGERQLQRYKFPDRRQTAAATRNPAHHGIDDELGHPQHGQRQDRPKKPEQYGAEHQRRAGLPHHHH
jgi:hypothetical protein